MEYTSLKQFAVSQIAKEEYVDILSEILDEIQILSILNKRFLSDVKIDLDVFRKAVWQYNKIIALALRSTEIEKEKVKVYYLDEKENTHWVTISPEEFHRYGITPYYKRFPILWL